MNPAVRRGALGIALLLFGPAAALAILLWTGLTPPPGLHPVIGYGILSLTLLPGLLGLRMLPLRTTSKLTAAPFYIFGMGFTLLYGALVTICVATRDCP